MPYKILRYYDYNYNDNSSKDTNFKRKSSIQG